MQGSAYIARRRHRGWKPRIELNPISTMDGKCELPFLESLEEEERKAGCAVDGWGPPIGRTEGERERDARLGLA